MALFSREEIRQMIEQGGSDVVCQFCGRKYSFGREHLLALTATHDA
jgi:redox-regulated HSP33 family molecular chaperone